MVASGIIDYRPTVDRIPLALTQITNPHIRGVRNYPFLQRAKTGTVNPALWPRFARERYQMSQYFVPLLEAMIVQGKDNAEFAEIGRVVQLNFDDEMGLSDPAAGSHESWRLDYYAAMQVTREHLLGAGPAELNGTCLYRETLKSLIDRGDYLAMAGALLALEVTIPHEYTFLLHGLEKQYPEHFDISAGGNAAQHKARRYLVDHIHHDAAHHAKDLFYALIPFAEDAAALQSIKTGADQIMAARQQFFADMETLALTQTTPIAA